jgi:helix-turn-helix protein
VATDDEIAAAYATGLSMLAVARLLHASELTVHRSLVRQGIERRSRGYRKDRAQVERKPIRDARRPVDTAAILDAYEVGASLTEVSEQCGVGLKTVTRVVRGAGIMRPASRRVRLPVEEIVDRYQAGESTPGIAEATGASLEGVRKVLIRSGVERRGRGYRSGRRGAATGRQRD